MYNIHNHYNNIYSLAKSITGEPSVVYLHPFGSSGIENIEVIGSGPYIPDESSKWHFIVGHHARTGPVLVCYDQEPLISNFNTPLLTHIKDHYVWAKLVPEPFQFNQDAILINTELDSDEKDQILKTLGYKDCYCFYHAFAASDWYRGYRYNRDLPPVNKRVLKKKFITFNRITSNARVYRSLVVSELINHRILDQGHVSFSINCPVGGRFDHELRNNSRWYKLPATLVNETISNINSLQHEPRIDCVSDSTIPNSSFQIDAIPQNMESFLHIVTETCYWGRKKHLTEKIFKPIVMRQPFVLVGCAHNLDYLKSYGFKTFDRWWDESYDNIEDDVERMHAIGNLLADICKNDLSRLFEILMEMEDVLEHNYRWFYNPEFLNNCWDELVTNLTTAIKSTP